MNSDQPPQPSLRKLEERLLRYLREHPNRVVSREELLEEVWGYDRRMQTRAVDIAVARVRKQVEVNPRRPQRLLSVRGEGYRWVPSEPTPPPRTRQPSVRRTNLRPRLLPLVGREEELRALECSLESETPIVTVLGMGGIGKTRLVHALGEARLERHPGGVWFCDLGDVADREGLLHGIARGLEIPLDEEEPMTRIERVLASRPPMLLILDNVERVSNSTTELLKTWSVDYPRHRYLITSRVRLEIPGERILALGALSSEDAKLLFLARAREARPKWQPDPTDPNRIATIVDHLEGHALALELAASRVAVMNLAELERRLADNLGFLKRPRTEQGERHGTLNDTIDWSWQLLPDWERRLLSRCTVFVGGFSLDAAETILSLDDGADGVEVMDGIQELCSHSMLAVHEAPDRQLRFRIPRAIREFVRSRTPDSPRMQALRSRHAFFYAHYGTESWLRESNRRDGQYRRSELATERDNLREAVGFAVRIGDSSTAALCAMAVAIQSELSGPFALGVDCLNRALGLPLPPDAHARLLRRKGWLLQRIGQESDALAASLEAEEIARSNDQLETACLAKADRAYLHHRAGRSATAEDIFVEVLAEVRVLDLPRVEAHILGNLAILLEHRGRIEEAEHQYRASLELHRSVENYRAQGHLKGNLGIFLAQQGRNEEARTLCTEALAIHQEMGNRPLQGNMMGALGHFHLDMGDIDEARACFERGLEIQQSLGNQRAIGLLLGNLGSLELDHGDSDRAETLLRNAIEIGDRTWPVGAGAFRGTLARALVRRDDLDGAWALVEEADPLLRGVHRMQLGVLLCIRARIARVRGMPEEAERARAEARSIADQLQLGIHTELRRALARIDA